MEFALDLMQTTALAMIFFLLGRVIVAHVEFLRRVCIPAPVVGGLVFALIHLALHSAGVVTFTFDETLKNAFMIWFFTSVGYGASFKVLARGIKPVLVFLLLAGVMVVIQDLVGAGLAQVFQLDGRLGLCMGSIPLVGGHGTAGSFGPQFEDAGVMGASVVAVACATYGLVSGSLMGGPIARAKIKKYNLHSMVNEGEEYGESVETAQSPSQAKDLGVDSIVKSFALLIIAAGIGTYILFQETYHKESYEHLHPTGPKSNYCYHTEAMDRAMEGGIDDVGLGVLFGLELYRYEFAGLLMHAEHLEAVHGVGPHTISVPRVKHADDIDPDEFDNGIDDETFLKICACIRVAVPYTGMIMSTRENQSVRERALHLGISQVSGGSRTSVGGYTEEERPHDTEQFDVSDNRTLDEVVKWLMELGYIPSFCTACYREGRTGDRFMSLCKAGQIQNCCHPNALMTLKEYLMDYAAPETKAIGEQLIQAELGNIPKEKVREICKDHLEKIEQGTRDFRF